MTTENMKALLDACYQAKRVRSCCRRCQKGSALLIFTIWIPSRNWNAAAFG